MNEFFIELLVFTLAMIALCIVVVVCLEGLPYLFF